MKTEVLLLSLLAASAFSTFGQGTLIYDQQSADESTVGGGGVTIQSNQPLGQSFAPTLSQVGFIRLYLFDRNSGNGFGATMYVNLLSNTITGPILRSTEAVFMPDGFGVGERGFTDFIFSNPVSVTPGTTYFFQPIVQSGDSWAVVVYPYLYANGDAYFSGTVSPNDLWFREGIIVPEPSSIALLLTGIGLSVLRRRTP